MIQTFITIILSAVLILIGHYCWNSLKDAYSTKKTKDLVGSQTQKYKNLLNEYIENTTNACISSAAIGGSSIIPYISEQDQADMNNDLMQLIHSSSVTPIAPAPMAPLQIQSMPDPITVTVSGSPV